MTLVREFNLYLTAGKSIPLVINVNQFDSGEQWVFTLYKEDGTQYTPSTGAIVGIKSDGLGIINSGSVVDGKVVINETEQMTAAAGRAVFELLIDSQTHGTANFVVLVEPKPGNNADLSESDLSLLQEAIDATSPLPTGGTVGQVLTKTANGSTWSDAGTPTQEQVAEAVSDWADEHITVETGVVIDTSLSVAGAAADAKKTGDEISDLKSTIEGLSAIPYEVKIALDTILQNVAFVNDDTYSSELSTIHTWATEVSLTSISAVFTQGARVIYANSDLELLKNYLVVTATYNDSSSSAVNNYTLSGTLSTGTSTISVSYGGKSTTFTVNVTASPVPSAYMPLDYLSSAVNGTPYSTSQLADTPYINTAFPTSDLDIINYTVEVEYLCRFTSSSYPTSVFTGRNLDNNNNTKGIQMLLGVSDTVFMYGNSSSSTSTLIRTALGYALTLNERHTAVFKDGNISIDGVTVAQTGASYAIQSSSNKWKLFAREQKGMTDLTALAPMIGNVYKFSVKDGSNNDVLNFVPCKRISDNVYGMYDTVSDTFYTSAISKGFAGGYEV